MPDHSVSIRPEDSPSPGWRAALLWGVVAVALAVGLFLAIRHGGDAPRLLDLVEVAP